MGHTYDHDTLMACFDRKGRRITLLTWGTLSQFPTYKTVGWDEPIPGIVVSTVWLGLNHGYTVGTMHIFETMVLDRDSGWRSLKSLRYATEEAALEGHLRVYRSLGGT